MIGDTVQGPERTPICRSSLDFRAEARQSADRLSGGNAALFFGPPAMAAFR